MPFPFVIWGAAALGAAVAGKLIHDAVTDNGGGSSSSTSTTTSGPSQAKLNRRAREIIYADFLKEFKQLWQEEDQLLCLKDRKSLDKYKQLAEQVRNNLLTPEKALCDLKELEKDKGDLTISEYNKSFLEIDFDNRMEMINFINEKFFTERTFAPKMEFADHYELCRDEYWLQFLYNAQGKGNMAKLGNFPDSWRRMTPELLKCWQDVQSLEAASIEGNEPRVVVCGMLKAGKSTLLNSLFDDPTNQHFPTARTRKTRENQSEILNGIRFIDTPGLDYNSDDTKEAQNAYTGADLLLFVHDGSKELEEIQLKFLKQLQEIHPDLSQKMIFVITSKLESGNKLDALRANILEKIMQRCGFSPDIFAVENNSYRSQKEKIKASSGIYELRTAIENFCHKINDNLENSRGGRKIAALDALNKAIEKIAVPVMKDRQELSNHHEEIFNTFKKIVAISKLHLKQVS